MIYAAFNETELFTGGTATLTTNSNVAVSGVNRAGFYVDIANTVIRDIGASVSSGWVHVRVFASAFTSGIGKIFALQNSSGQELCSVTITSGTLHTIAISGTSNIGVASASSTLYLYDVRFKIGSAGYVRFYRNGSLIANYEGTISLPSGEQSLSRLAFSGKPTASVYYCYLSHVIVSDEVTIGARVHTLGLTTTADTDWTGTVANITGTSYATQQNAVHATSAGEKLLASQTMPSLAEGERLAAVFLSASAIKELPEDSSMVGNQIDPLFKYAGNYIEADSPLVLNDTTFTEQVWGFQTHPATDEAWTPTNLNATNVGLIAEVAA